MRRFKEFEAGPDDEGRRIDRLLRRLLPEAPLSELYRALRTGAVRLGGKKVGPATRVSAADRLSVDEALLTAVPDSRAESPEPPPPPAAPARAPKPPSPPLVLLETPDLLFVSKPRGMLSHGPGGLDLFLRERYRAEMAASLAFVPGPLHRLDRNTSGIVVCSRSLEGARRFSALLREGGLRKSYLALLQGLCEEEEIWEDRLLRDGETKISRVAAEAGSGREARSRLRPLLSREGLSLALVEIETGRTHQIRAQAAAHGHPLAGDRKYGGRAIEGGPFLHAWRLEFPAPGLPGLPSCVEAEPPADFAAFLDRRFPGAWRRILRELPCRKPATLQL